MDTARAVKLLSVTRFDLQELLFRITTPKKEKNKGNTRPVLNAPAFMQYVTSPFYFLLQK